MFDENGDDFTEFDACTKCASGFEMETLKDKDAEDYINKKVDE